MVVKQAEDHVQLALIEAVKGMARASDNTYGSRRIKAALKAMSYPVSRNKAKKRIKATGVEVKSRK